MTKQDVFRQITDKTGIDPLTTRLITEAFFEVVKDSLTEGKPIYIRSFGSFVLKQRASKIGRNISQHTSVRIAAHAIPYFKPSAEFTDQVRRQERPTNQQKST